jgi:hypothetical protein
VAVGMVSVSAAGTLVCRVDVLMRRISSWSCGGADDAVRKAKYVMFSNCQ